MVPFTQLLAIAAIAIACSACTVRNDAYCCSSAASCEGAELSPCMDPARPFCDDSGEFGVGHSCIPDPAASDCEGPADCTNPDRPLCIDNVCVQCDQDGDCDAATPVCNLVSHLCGACEEDLQCEARVDATRCFVDDGACVQCLDGPADCTSDTAPVCDDDSHACRGCTADDECPSDVCDESSGACIDEANVIYLTSTGASSGTCTQATPCNTFALGLAAVAGGRNVIKAAPGTYTGPIDVNALTVTIFADGVTAQPASTEAILLVRNAADATIEGLKITGVIGSGSTVAATCTGSTLRLRRSSIVANTGGGGVLLDGCEFSLVNNVIAVNGSGTSLFGGVKISDLSNPGMHELLFNTITANSGTSNAITGVECASVLTPLVFSNNIVYGNPVMGLGTQVGGSASCTWTYSDIGPAQTVAGTGNINTDPMFVDPATRNFHIMPGSPVENLADAAATVPVDLDGDARPQDGRSDIGADELVP